MIKSKDIDKQIANIDQQMVELRQQREDASAAKMKIMKMENFEEAKKTIARVQDDLENLLEWGYMPKVLLEAMTSATTGKVSVRMAIRPLREPK